jgi:D-glycero-D-manno-heptose 1,7-bisphosphate phosphatase
MASRSALFLDLGGTLVRIEDDEVYLDGARHIELLPNVVERLREVSYDTVLLVTNQSGIGRGTRSFDEVRGWIEQLDAALGGGVISDWWASPRPDSVYRKPAPGMVLALTDKHHIDLGRSLFVGDTESDRACAEAAGVAFEWAREFFGWAANFWTR